MTAITRSASTMPASISPTSPDASLTLSSGTLRTSIGSAISVPSLATAQLAPFTGGRCSRSGDDGTGASGKRVGDPVQRGDRGALPAVFDETARRVHLRPHRTAGELPGGR